MRAPEIPLPEAVEAHRRTHVPYASWCAECVAGRGSDNPHRRLYGELAAPPVVACDNNVLSVAGGGDNSNIVTSIVMVDCETTYATASVVPYIGPETFPVRFGLLFLQDLGYPRMVLKTDGA